MDDTINFDLNKLIEAWGAPVVARTEVGRFSGGVLNPRTMANLDSLMLGPGKIPIGGKIAYNTEALVAWMKNRHTKVKK